MMYDLEELFQLRNKNNPEVEIGFAPGMEEYMIRTERYRFIQAISNLVINAIKFIF